jgi:hypothetical protein
VREYRAIHYAAVGFATATLLVAAACKRGAPPSRETVTHADVPAALILVEGLDEEGGMIGRTRLPDTALVAFFRDHVMFADARFVVEYLAPSVRMDVADGELRFDGSGTGIHVEFRDGVSFAPLRRVADRFRAYARIEESPGRMATVWRHDVLCRYARGADRGAEIFLEAAEQGLLRLCQPPIDVQVRRWRDALPNEQWAASVTLREPLDSADAAALVAEYGARPYAAYGGTGGHRLVVQLPPDSASMEVFGRLRADVIESLERALCGLPGALGRRGGMTRRRASGADPFRGERHMLASAFAARYELQRLRAGGPIIQGVDVIAPVTDLRRLAGDTRVHRFGAGTKLDGNWVVPGVDVTTAGGAQIPSDVAALDSAALFARLQAEAARAAADCPRGRGP